MITATSSIVILHPAVDLRFARRPKGTPTYSTPNGAASPDGIERCRPSTIAAASSSAASDTIGKYDGTSAASQPTSIADTTTSMRPAPVPRPASGAYSNAAPPARTVTAIWNASVGN